MAKYRENQTTSTQLPEAKESPKRETEKILMRLEVSHVHTFDQAPAEEKKSDYSPITLQDFQIRHTEERMQPICNFCRTSAMGSLAVRQLSDPTVA